ncbi:MULTISPECIES: 4-hydroxy-tetrahydrodipicolinate synthase [Rheinheimera]|uniref:4-hydroxy-tetrahydrodipicolinate synthase n=1 Tax=Rheinheimera marina TaxID=1774958 RepID=A0ABV9JR13_9GAMM
MLSGSIVALITPMHSDGSVDFASLKRLVEFHLANKTSGLVIMGTTAESATLTFDEQWQVLNAVLEQVAGRIPVIAGNGSNSTAEAIAKTQKFSELPVAGFLTVTPYYNKPTQKGMLAHFQAVAAATDKPVWLYNVPGRTGVDLQAETVAELAKVPNIVGIKEATGSFERLEQLKALCPADFVLLSGDDATCCDFILQGGKGVISVTSNIAPALMAQMCAQALAKEQVAAHQTDQALQALHRDLFVESNPIPAKWALLQMGLIADDMARLPLTRLEPIYHSVIEQALKQAQITIQE